MLMTLAFLNMDAKRFPADAPDAGLSGGDG